jgi:hypothetical protein
MITSRERHMKTGEPHEQARCVSGPKSRRTHAAARELFANRIGGFFGLDVLCTLLMGVSCGFPLFLYMREPHLRAVR